MACEEFRDVILDLLYGEGDAARARAFEVHQQRCADCRDEMSALRGVRRDLREWVVPALPRATRGRAALYALRSLPVAAGLVLAVAGALSFAAAERRADRLTAALHDQDLRHRAELAALKSSLGAAPSAGDVTLDEVRRMIRESESRQAVFLDASLRGLSERTDAQRREDLAQVSAGFSYLEGRTGLQVARTTELMGHVLQASQKK